MWATQGSHEIVPGPSSKGDLISLCISCCPFSPVMGLAPSISIGEMGCFKVDVVVVDPEVTDVVVEGASRAQLSLMSPERMRSQSTDIASSVTFVAALVVAPVAAFFLLQSFSAWWLPLSGWLFYSNHM